MHALVPNRSDDEARDEHLSQALAGSAARRKARPPPRAVPQRRSALLSGGSRLRAKLAPFSPC